MLTRATTLFSTTKDQHQITQKKTARDEKYLASVDTCSHNVNIPRNHFSRVVDTFLFSYFFCRKQFCHMIESTYAYILIIKICANIIMYKFIHIHICKQVYL